MNLICMVRHGETDANKNMIVQGRIDNPLNAKGMAQAEAIAAAFSASGETYDVIVASPLKRAAATARVIADKLGRIGEIELDPGFLERDFGEFDGHAINPDYARMVIENRIPKMEKHEVLEARVFAALLALCERHPGKRILLVTHSHVIKAVLVRLLPPSEFNYASYLANCSMHHLSYADGAFKVIDFNRTV